MTRSVTLFGERSFRWLWTAETISKLGDSVTVVALPLVAILTLQASPIQIGLIGAAQFVPMLAFGLAAGVWVDRRRRTVVMILADVTRAVSLATIPLAHQLGVLTLPHLAAVAFINSAAACFGDVALAAYVPRLVETDRLIEANSRLELSRSASQVVGPNVAGVLIGAFGAPLALLLDAASFGGSAIALGRIRAREADPRAGSHEAPPPIWHEMKEAISFVANQPQVRAIVATASINNLFRFVGFPVLLIYLARELSMAPEEIGLAIGLGNIGFLVGALIARRASIRMGVGRAMLLSVSLFGPGMLLVVLAPASWALPAATAMYFLNGLGIAVHSVSQLSLRQVLTPDRLRARVAAVNRLLILSGPPLGTLIGGFIGQFFGLRTALWISAIGLCTGTLPYLLSATYRLRTMPAAVLD